MDKLKQIWYEFKLKGVKNSLMKNSEKIELAVKSGTSYNQYYLEQLRLMSNKSYLENKLSWIGN